MLRYSDKQTLEWLKQGKYKFCIVNDGLSTMQHFFLLPEEEKNELLENLCLSRPRWKWRKRKAGVILSIECRYSDMKRKEEWHKNQPDKPRRYEPISDKYQHDGNYIIDLATNPNECNQRREIKDK